MVKIIFGKNWQWYQDVSASCNITNKNVDVVYRIDANPCFYGSCKSNCSTNPYCLNGFGERKLHNLLQKETTASIEKKSYFREPEQYVGLVNLGATCYINAYLQVWFNNYFFRDRILALKLKKLELEDNYVEDNLSNKSSKMPELSLKSNECLVSNLQMLFTLLNETIRKSIDPSFFVKALGLDQNIQQDAQEFSQLFLSLIQSILASTSDLCPREQEIEGLSNFGSGPNSDLIHDLFQGEYKYVTECNSCKLQSIRNSNFFEITLNIQNVQTINDCINELLNEELMEGDNQYFCDNCRQKTDAKRCTKISRLPPILNLQLLRFVYDRNSGTKKKLSNKVKFCENLELSSLVEDQTNTTYHLGAILLHVGKTAYSGHYTAQIKKFQTNEWFNFNDEVITKIKKKHFLGQSTEDGFVTAEKNDKSDDKSDKKGFSSRNAYLLVYYRSDLVKDIPKESPVCLSNQSEIVQVDNQLLENWFNNLNSDTIGQKEIQNSERTVIHSIYENIWLNKSQKKNKSKELSSSESEESLSIDKELYYFIPTDFVRKLVSGEFDQIKTELDSITSKYLCDHNRLNPLAINRFKLVSRTGLKIFCDKNSTSLKDIGALEAFNNSSVRCWPCVFNCFNYLKFKEDIKQDMKRVRQLLKYEYDEQKASVNDDDIILIEKNIYQDNKENRNVADAWFWVGKESLKQWQNLAIKKLELNLPSMKFVDLADTKPEIIEEPNGTENDNDVQELSSYPQSSNNLICSSNSLSYFNEDLLCPHKNLIPGQNKRLVCPELWNQIFYKYFFKQDLSDSYGNDMESQSADSLDDNKNSIFTNLSQECKICSKENEEHISKKAQVKTQKEMLPDLYFNKNRPLINDLQPEITYYIIMTDFVKEWRALIKNSKFKDIQIFNQILLCQHGCLPFDEKTIDLSMSTILTEFEWEFISNNYPFDKQIKVKKLHNLDEAEEAQLNFEFEPQVCKDCLAQNQFDKMIFENKKILIRVQDEEENNSTGKLENLKNKEIEDSDIIHISSKKARYSPNEDGMNTETNDKEIMDYIPARRSKRPRRSKKDLEIICSSYTTIKLIKQNIASKISRLISEQHLFFNNTELDNEKSIIDYRINKGDLLVLKLDQIDSNMDEDSSHYEMAHVPEVGFKGSNLIR